MYILLKGICFSRTSVYKTLIKSSNPVWKLGVYFEVLERVIAAVLPFFLLYLLLAYFKRLSVYEMWIVSPDRMSGELLR
jgi:hypothetical protein